MPRLLALALIAVLVACSAPMPPAAGYDPYEAENRAQFDANLSLMGGGSRSAESGPSPVRRAVMNVGDFLGTPSSILNDLLQLRPDRAAENALRLVVNGTVGLAGIFDPATRIGLAGRSSDFGETLHRWGVGEGAYVVLPLVGPSTERDAAGMVVDLLIDPVGVLMPRRVYGAALVLRGAGRVARAIENADLLDANVIATADPYAQARLLSLQARRYHLGIENEDDFIDPYSDF